MFTAFMLAYQVYDPCIRHVALKKWVFSYVHLTIKLVFSHPMNIQISMEAFCPVYWSACRDNRTSTTGILGMVNEVTVLSFSKKQSVIALLSGEAVSIAVLYCQKRLQWLLGVFWELFDEETLAEETVMYLIYISFDHLTPLYTVYCQIAELFSNEQTNWHQAPSCEKSGKKNCCEAQKYIFQDTNSRYCDKKTS